MPEIVLTINPLPTDKLPEIYNSADVTVIPTRGEGFGLTFAESMACGVPCIATDFGGHCDFMNEDNSYLVDYDLKPAPKGIINLIYEESEWAEPNLLDLKAVMRQAFEDKDLLKKKKENTLKDIQKWNWDNAAKIAKEVIEKSKLI